MCVEKLCESASSPVVLSGAGMSAESGVPTFRDALTGLWENFDPAQLATEEAFRANPQLVFSWYVWRAQLVREVSPNPGHEAIAQWQHNVPGLQIVTQNVDDLHERSGAEVLAHLHGDLFAWRCLECAAPVDFDLMSLPKLREQDGSPVYELIACAQCDEGVARPGVVWFGESLPLGAFSAAENAVRGADLVVVVGTSGLVYPAASLPWQALEAGIPVVEINPAATDLTPVATHHVAEACGIALPRLLGFS